MSKQEPNTSPTAVGAAAPGPDLRRRRLLLGAGALPSVLTLSSGAMAAVGSSTCVVPPPNPPQEFTMWQDHWVRTPVREGDYERQTAYCVSAPQAHCVDNFNPDHAGAGSEWRVLGAGETMSANDFSPVRLHNRHAYGLVYVDREGTIATLDPHAAPDLSPVTQSCWTSLTGTRGLRLG